MKPPIIFLAPDASHPPMDGSSYRSWSIAREASLAGENCYYFAKERFYKITPGGTTEQIDTVRSNRSKPWSALRSVLFGSHYLVEKHLPAAWVDRATRWIGQLDPGMLYMHLIWSWRPGWAGGRPVPVYIDTQNYESEWWGNLRRSSTNWLSRRVCDNSNAYALKTLAALPPSTTLVHVSTADRDRYAAHRPDLRHVVLANGCDVQPRRSAPSYAAPRKRLYFLGALNLKMTGDALQYFSERFWPALAGCAEMTVFGSGDSPTVDALCQANGWALRKNLSDDALKQALEGMHYLVLPFSYSAGSKLKLINACGKNIPVISTRHGVTGFDAPPPTVFVSEDPAEWAVRVRREEPPTSADLAECQRFADEFSWGHLVKNSGLLPA